MKDKVGNIYKLPNKLPPAELFEILLDNNKVLIERVISTGQVTPEGEWYDQDKDEWLIVL